MCRSNGALNIFTQYPLIHDVNETSPRVKASGFIYFHLLTARSWQER